jgi:hypothetical protein
MGRDDNLGNFVCLCGENSTGSVSIACPGDRSISVCATPAPYGPHGKAAVGGHVDVFATALRTAPRSTHGFVTLCIRDTQQSGKIMKTPMKRATAMVGAAASAMLLAGCYYPPGYAAYGAPGYAAPGYAGGPVYAPDYGPGYAPGYAPGYGYSSAIIVGGGGCGNCGYGGGYYRPPPPRYGGPGYGAPGYGGPGHPPPPGYGGPPPGGPRYGGNPGGHPPGYGQPPRPPGGYAGPVGQPGRPIGPPPGGQPQYVPGAGPVNQRGYSH